MNRLVKTLKKLVPENNKSRCLAVVNGETCDNESWGRGSVNGGYEVKYCKRHAPSGVTPGIHRSEELQYYIPSEDEVITVS